MIYLFCFKRENAAKEIHQTKTVTLDFKTVFGLSPSPPPAGWLEDGPKGDATV